MNDSEPVHFGASFKTVYYSHSFSNLGFLKSSTPTVFSYRESFENIGKDHTKFLEKQLFTQGEDWRFIWKVNINKLT